MNREEGFNLLKKHIKNEKMIAHCLASEAVMRALAERLGEDKEKWGLAGLLHDLDAEIVQGDPILHGLETEKMLQGYGLDNDITEAVKLHNEEASHGQQRSKKFHYALAAGETITGLIFATALVYPDKKLESVKPKSITKRMKEKAFAASVNRETIRECEKIGLSVNEFAEIALNAMKKIAPQLGF